MPTFRSYLNALIAVCAAVLAGCGAAQTLGPSPPAAPNAVRALHVSRGRSWMSPNAGKNELLYVSTYSATYGSSVYVLSWPGLTLEGQLSVGAYGLCSDAKGDVYMTVYGEEEILEYAHGGTKPIKTLGDANAFPYGCSVDGKTGNLAVTNLFTVEGTQAVAGNILVFRKGHGTPTTYQNSSIIYVPYFCAYDNKGNLFVDGENGGGTFALAEIVPKNNLFEKISVNVTMGLPGGVQWQKSGLIIGDQGDEDGSQALYEFSVSGSEATETGSTPLTGATDVPEGWVAGKSVIAPDYKNDDVAIYPYPAGGSPTNSYSFGTDRSGFGAAISAASKKR